MTINKSSLTDVLINLVYIGVPLMIATGMATAFQPLSI